MLVLNNTLILGIWCSTVPHLPGCFCPWTFFQNIGFNMVPSDPCMSHLATQLGYSAGEFQALQLIVLATFGVMDYLPSACWSTFWKSIFKHQLGCRFDILDSISSFLCILTYAIIYVLIHHIIYWLYLYFLNILYFSSTPVLSSPIDVVFVLFIGTKEITTLHLNKQWPGPTFTNIVLL